MRLLFSEFQTNYSKYHFPYQVYLVKETTDSIDSIYNMGFLPSRTFINLYYLARSVRIDLAKFKLSSENRRILRKTKYLDYSVHKLSEFDYTYRIGKFGKDYYDQRFGKKTMSALKIKWLFTSGACTHVFVYRDSTKSQNPIGYCPVVLTDTILHYAYPFYNPDYFKKNAGMGMMISAILWAMKHKKRYVYLGTCYTEASLYKTQFRGFEYFNGFGWESSIDALKDVVRRKIHGHRIQQLKDKSNIFKDQGISVHI